MIKLKINILEPQKKSNSRHIIPQKSSLITGIAAIPNLKSSGRSRRDIQLQLFNHKIEEMVPTIKTEIAGQGPNIIEKGLSGP